MNVGEIIHAQKEHDMTTLFSELGCNCDVFLVIQLWSTYHDLDSDHSKTSVFKELLAYLRRKITITYYATIIKKLLHFYLIKQKVLLGTGPLIDSVYCNLD